MPRAATGQLIWRKTGWYARVRVVLDGERVRVCKALGTKNKAVARRKLERLLASDNPKAEDVTRPESFEEAGERVYQARIDEVQGDDRAQREELAQLRRYAFPIIGKVAASAVKPADVNTALDHAKAAGLSRQSVQHLRQRITNVFAQLKREGAIVVNPAADAELPKFSEGVTRERAVLTDHELALYLAWEHPEERFQGAVRERQVMACVSRMFGGIRTGDLHALRWEAFDVEAGAFTWGYAPRQKTRRPQLLEVPELLRPLLRDHWERAGRPREGLVFPVRRVGKLGDRVGQERRHVSHAGAFRRDVQEAFKAARKRGDKTAPEADTPRWRELFEVTEGAYTLPVDFHSWRRAFAQALADADVNAQQAAALAGHSSLSAHARYLRSAGKMRKLPEAALPALMLQAPIYADREAEQAAEHRALTNGQGTPSDAENDVAEQGASDANARDFARADAVFLPVTPEVAGSSPVRPASSSSKTPENLVTESRATSESENEKALGLPNGQTELPDHVEHALADAITKAANAGAWSTVETLSRELTARREARAGVVHIGARKRGKGAP